MQCGFSGGEPLQRDDLEILVAEAHRLGYYTNLLTSGIGLDEQRVARLKEAGLDHIQLSFQDSTREINDFLSSTRTFDLKRKAAALIKQHGYPMVMNCVIHRLNIDHIDRIIELAVELGAEYLELANTQFYSWAHINRDQLLPTREQLQRAEAITNRWREKLGSKMKLFFVVPDYYETRPKKCMNGWGNVFLTIAPDGIALPCHTARMLPGLAFPNVREHERARHLVRIRRLQPLSRHRLDEGAVRELSRAREGSRRLPLPGLHAGAGSGRGRSGLRQVAAPRRARRNGRSPAGAARRCAGDSARVPRAQGIARVRAPVLNRTGMPPR